MYKIDYNVDFERMIRVWHEYSNHGRVSDAIHKLSEIESHYLVDFFI